MSPHFRSKYRYRALLTVHRTNCFLKLKLAYNYRIIVHLAILIVTEATDKRS